MVKYLVELKDGSTGDMTLLQLQADSCEQAAGMVNQSHPGYEVVKIKSSHGGKRTGSGRTGKYGDGVKTKPYRLPISIGENLPEILAELEMVNNILEVYEARVNESKGKTASGAPAERYKYVAELVSSLREATRVINDNII